MSVQETSPQRLSDQIRVGQRILTISSLGPLVLQTRKERNQRQEEVAEFLGISAGALSRLEQGKNLPSTVVLHRMVRYLYGDEVQVEEAASRATQNAKLDYYSAVELLTRQTLELTAQNRVLVLKVVRWALEDSKQER